MEKKYLEGVAVLPMMGDTKVVFDDVKNIIETDTHLEFDDVEGHYSFTRENNLWSEDNDKSPDLKEYRIICRRTARKHNLVGDQAERVQATANDWRDKDSEAAEYKQEQQRDWTNVLLRTLTK